NTDGTFYLDTLLPYRDYSILAKMDGGGELPLETDIYLLNENGDRVLRLIRETNDYFRFYALTQDEVDNLPVLSTEGLQEKLAGKIFKKLPGDIPKNLTVYLLSDEGLRLDSALIDEFGNFEFTQLPIDKPYKLKVQDLPNEEDVKLVIVDETGTQENVAQNDDGTFKYERKNTFQGMIYSKLAADKPEGMKVYLLDDDGGVLDIAVTDQFGNFNFQKLPTDKNFIIKTANASDSDLGLLVLDEDGEIKDTLGTPDQKGQFAYTNYTNLNTLITIGDYDVASGLKLELSDKTQRVIRNLQTDKNGNIKIDSVSPESTYRIKLLSHLSKADQAETNLFILNSKGQKVQKFPLKNNGFNIHPLEQANYDLLPPIIPAKTQVLSGLAYQKLPGDLPDHMPIHLVNDDGEIVFTTFVDSDGKFEFDHVPQDGNYKLKMDEAIDNGTMVITDDNNKALAVVTQTGDDFDYKILKSDQASLSVLSVTDVTLQIRDTINGKLVTDTEKGNIPLQVFEGKKVLLTTTTNSDGSFVLPNLSPYSDYTLKIPGEFADKVDLNSQLFITNSQNKPVKEMRRTEALTFAFHSLTSQEYDAIPPLEERSDKMVVGRVYEKLPGDIPQGMKVYALNDDGARIDSSFVDQYGNFVFEELPPDQAYKLSLENVVDDVKLVVLNDLGEENSLQKSAQGTFEYLEPDKFKGQLQAVSDTEKIAGSKVYLMNEDGGILEVAELDDNGYFEFKELPKDKKFIIKTENEDPGSEIVVFDEWGSQEALSKSENGTFSQEPQKGFDGFVYNELKGDIPAGLKVYLVDDAGGIIDSTLLKKDGSFAFQTDHKTQNLNIKLDTAVDLKAFVLDENNQHKPLAQSKNGQFVVSQKTKVKFLFDYIDSKQQFQMDLINATDTVKLTNITSGDIIQADDLQANKKYVVNISSANISRLEDLDVFLVNAKGEPVQKLKIANGKGQFYALPVENYQKLTALNSVETMQLEGFAYEQLRGDLPPNLPVHLVNDDGEIVFTTFVDSTGKFVFDEIPMDQKLSVKMDNVIDQGKIVLVDENENALAIIEQKDSESFDYHLLSTDKATIKLLSATDISLSISDTISARLNLPSSSPIHLNIKNLDNQDKFSTITDADGNFNIPNVIPYEHYQVIVAPEDVDKVSLDVEMVILNNQGKGVKKMHRGAPNYFEFESLTKDEYDRIPVLEDRDDGAVFGRVYEELPGDIPEGLMVYALNDSGERIDSAAIDQFGNFIFKELPTDNIQLQLSQASDDTKLVLVDDKGTEAAVTKTDIGNFYHVAPEPLVGKIKDTSSAGSKVYLLDENGGVIDVAIVDGSGSFEFKELPPDQKIIIKAENEDTGGEIVLIDEWGTEETLAQDQNGGFAIKEKKKYEGFVYESLNPELPKGLKVYLVDDSGNILDSTLTLEKGRFEFLTAAEAENLSIKIEGDNPNLQTDIVQHGARKSLSKNNGTFELTKTREIKGFFYSKLPNDIPPGIMVYLLDRNGKLIDSAKTDQDGFYRFKTDLPLDEITLTTDYKSLIALSGEVIEYGINYVLDRNNKNYQIGDPAIFKGRAFYPLEADLPKGLKIYLIDGLGNKIDSSLIDKNGLFGFRYSKLSQETTLLFPEEVQDNILIEMDQDLANQLNLEAFEEYHRPQQPVAFKGRAFYPLGPDTPEGLKVFLVDGAGNKIDSAIIDKNGFFSFSKELLTMNTTLTFDDKVKGNILIDIGDQLAKQLNLEAFEEYHRPQQPVAFKGRAFYPLGPDTPEGLKVFLIDGAGNKIDSAIIDKNGFFSFSKELLAINTTLTFDDKVKGNILIDIDDQ
ncbi:MAG: carboxypeptidase-like regulatory domain-containing protein, partial [Flavobacteriales bacterium]|nr:carboxypeptidase-like regulatory domain-containing protein [Flavobacteriales bacterium]